MTQEQINELLKPRYIVENLWFNCEFMPGDILVKIPHSNAFSVQGYESGIYAITDTDIDKFPYLVRKLEWWEELPIEQLPTYVKPHPERDFMKDDKWVYKANWVMHDHGPCHEYMDGPWTRHIHANNLLPATESDYNEYLQTLTHNQEP